MEPTKTDWNSYSFSLNNAPLLYITSNLNIENMNQYFTDLFVSTTNIFSSEINQNLKRPPFPWWSPKCSSVIKARGKELEKLKTRQSIQRFPLKLWSNKLETGTLNFDSLNNKPYNAPIFPLELSSAINRIKPAAVGPDRVHVLMICVRLFSKLSFLSLQPPLVILHLSRILGICRNNFLTKA